MTSPERDAIVFVGPMGAGKTSIGKRVARILGIDFTDTDKAVAAAHGAIPSIFERYGEPQFRVWEREAVHRALGSGGVVALGGGAVLDAATRAELSGHRVVLLTVEPRIVVGRLRSGSRPLLEGEEDVIERWKRIADERRPLYDEVADVRFDTSHGPLQGVVDEIVEWIQREESVA